MATLEGTTTGIELNKRFYIPGITLKSNCPKCGSEHVHDFTYDYLSYPKTGKPEEVWFSCECVDPEEEWSESVIVNVLVTLAGDTE